MSDLRLGFLKEPNYVCNVLVLYNFGERHPNSNDKKEGYINHGVCVPDMKTFVAKAKSVVKNHNDRNDHSSIPMKVENLAVIMAVLSSKQPKAQKILREFGFTEAGPYHQDKYDHTISVFTMQAGAFVEHLNELS